MDCPFLVGERLYLRPLDEVDLDRCMRWVNDPELLPFLMRRTPMNRSAEREWLLQQGRSEANFSLAIVLKDGDRHIGNAGLHGIHPFNRSAEFGILIGEADGRGRGHGTEAARLLIDHGFRELGLHRIQLHVYAFNERARRAYEKVGFRAEGTEREAYYRNGRFHDVIVMSILESEWEAS
ncbi:MAG: GNAT family protein [Candidatus Bipolaricaulis sp.]|nr:GNAT family protein [Candidatus Bipolaricaulis sp.]MDD5646084.1 GNAT family protein [Candidatus Bipolaricaulis sp.]